MVTALKRLLFALTACVMIATPTAAHLWHDAVGDLSPTEIEAAIVTLETAADSIAEENWHPPEAAAGNSMMLAFALLRKTDGVVSLSEETQRILLTYEAMRLGVADDTGAFTEDADIFAWIEVIRPADAAAIAPFRARLEAWRARYPEGPE
jgi:hypothetical protein